METGIEQHVERIKEAVTAFYDQHAEYNGLGHLASPARDHVINIGTSILCTKWKVGYPGGSFAEAVAGNNLMEAFGRADEINQHALKFYCSLMYNQPYVS